MLQSVLNGDSGLLAKVSSQPDKYKLQVIYTQIDRNENGDPVFTDHAFGKQKGYFYPASTVKLPMSILALMKLREIKVAGLTRKTKMLSDSNFYCQRRTPDDSVTGGSFPSLENYIKRMMLVSDNYSYSRTYEFVGYEYAHRQLKQAGYQNIRLFSRLDASCPGDTAKITPSIQFISEEGKVIYTQEPGIFETRLYHPIQRSVAGRAFMNGRKRVNSPKDFSNHNYLELKDLHCLMKTLVFNGKIPGQTKLQLAEEDRHFLLQQMGSLPKESSYPKYDVKQFYDSFKKYFIYGSAVPRIEQDSIRIINTVGRAYGFLIDCAYVVDLKNKVEFFLTCGIYVNERNVIGSGRYEYDQIGLPYMKQLSLAILDLERQRKRSHEPDLSEIEKLFNH